MAARSDAEVLEGLDLVLYGFRVERGGLPLDFVGRGLGPLFGRELPDDLAAVAGIWAEAIHLDDRPHEAAYMARLASGEPADVTYRIVLPDGTVRRLFERGRPTVDADGSVRVLAVVGEVRGDLVRQGSGTAAAAPLSATVYHAVRAGGRLIALRVGEDWADTTGLETEPERALDALAAAVHPSDVDMFRERERLIHAGLPFDGAFRIIDRSGAVRWLSERATPRERAGRAEVDGVLVDVSRQNALFDDVRSLDSRLRHLLDALDAHVYTLVLSEDGAVARAEFLGPRLDVIYGQVPAPHVDVDALWTGSVHPGRPPRARRALGAAALGARDERRLPRPRARRRGALDPRRLAALHRRRRAAARRRRRDAARPGSAAAGGAQAPPGGARPRGSRRRGVRVGADARGLDGHLRERRHGADPRACRCSIATCATS